MAVEDPTTRLAAAHAQLTGLAAGLGSAERASRRPVTEYDRTGTVSVQVDADARVQRVRVASAWRRTLGPDGIGPAVQEALTTAAFARTRAWAEHLDLAPDALSRATVDAPAPAPDVAAAVAEVRASNPDPDAELRNLRDLLAEMREALTTVSAELAARAAAQHVGRSAGGHVTVTAGASGEVRTVEVDTAWAERAQPADLGRELTEALVAAREQQERAAVDLLVNGPLAEARRLAADPVAVARRLARP